MKQFFVRNVVNEKQLVFKVNADTNVLSVTLDSTSKIQIIFAQNLESLSFEQSECKTVL